MSESDTPLSTGTEPQQQTRPPPQICRFYKRDGNCREGDKCIFSHDVSPSTKGTEKENRPDSAPRTKQVLCKFYAKGYCSGGNKCTFLHERPQRRTGRGDKSKENGAQEGKKSARICNFYKAGNCRKGDACYFRHPDYLKKGDADVTKSEDGDATKPEPESTDKTPSPTTAQELDSSPCDKEPATTDLDDGSQSQDESSSSERIPYQRPVIEAKTSMKMLEVTDVGINQMRATEIKQLKIRFPEAELQGRERVQTFRIVVNPSDPDWPYDLRDFELLISFPANYPLVPFRLDMPEDQDLPESVMDSMVPKMQEWVSAKYATNEVAGKVELIFRPFLRWFDRKLETLFTDAARKFKKHVDAKNAGFEFVSFKDSGAGKEEKKFEVSNEPSLDTEASDDTLGDTTPATSPDTDDDESKTTTLAKSSNFDPVDTNRRGTEVLFRGMQLSEGVGTLVCKRLSISIQCSRCKSRSEIKTPARRPNVALCAKCQRQQHIAFRPSLAHKFSSVIGFLDLEGCTAFDLVLMDCEFSAGCINCPKEILLGELHYGQTNTTWCGKCHQKIEVLIESTKFTKLVASEIDASNAHVIDVKRSKKPTKDPAIQEGKPLPDNGTCKHYKKSFRWLRFPCCGKTYPCDECHDDSEPDHEMKYAIRMICGFCCKEQPFTTEKPCISCKNMTTKGKTPHWEGGKGCRDKAKMSKNDSQKYSGSSMKTVSKKAQKVEDQKKGKHKK